MTKEEYDDIVNMISAKDIDTIKLGIYLILDLQEFQNLSETFEFQYKIELPITSNCNFYLLETISKKKLFQLLEISKEEGWKTSSKFLKVWIENQFSEFKNTIE